MSVPAQPALSSLYDRLRDANSEMDSWQSDLYVKKTPEVEAVIKAYEDEGYLTNKTVFISNDEEWFDLPFHYTPYWTAKLSNQEGVADNSDDETPAAPGL